MTFPRQHPILEAQNLPSRKKPNFTACLYHRKNKKVRAHSLADPSSSPPIPGPAVYKHKKGAAP
nr:hypothetical protein [Bacillaceae bacterium]